MTDDLSEFSWIDPDSVHLVGRSANGVERPLLAKMAAEVGDAADALIKAFVDGLCGVERCSVCKTRLEGLSEDAVAKAKMKAKERHALDDSDFAFPKERKEPLTDASHVRNAMSRFSQVQDVSAAERKAAAHKIIARAKELGVEVGDDSDVAEAAKQTAPDKSIPEGEAGSQTADHIGDPDPNAAAPPEAHDGGESASIPGASERPSETTGQGDTAPDKALPTSEAEHAQTDDAQKRAVDMTGDAASNGDAAVAEAKAQAEQETRERKARKEAIGIARRLGYITKAQARAAAKGKADSAPGSPAWEHKDVGLGEKAEALISQLAGVVHTFTEREKAEGAEKSALREVTPTNLQKEIEAMTTDELVKLFDERDARLVKAIAEGRDKAQKKAKKADKKSAKREKKDAKAAELAAKAAGEPVADERLTKALAQAEEAAKSAAEARKLVEKMAAEDGKRIVTNPEGLTAALRGPEAATVFKQFEDAVTEAEARLEKATGDAIPRAEMELRMARSRRDTAKMIANENARAADPSYVMDRLNGRGTPLFGNRHALPDDPSMSYPMTHA